MDKLVYPGVDEDEVRSCLRETTLDPTLHSLDGLYKQLEVDKKRAGAAIALTKSGLTRISRTHRVSPRNRPLLPSKTMADIGYLGPDEDEHENDFAEDDQNAIAVQAVSGEEVDMDGDGVITLEEAFQAHARNFDADQDGKINVEELVHLFDKCGMFDEWLTANKVRVYFATLAEGCNYVSNTLEQVGHSGIGYLHFESLLRWAADLKGVKYSRCVSRVIRQSRTLSDKSGSMRRKLQIVFEMYGKQNPGYISAHEFACLSWKLDVYTEKFTIADVHIFFVGRGTQFGVDFEGFVCLLNEIDLRLGIEHKVFRKFAEVVDNLDNDKETLTKIRFRLRRAASTVGGRDWRMLFYDVDEDHSGKITWDEFHTMCRKRLHITDSAHHVRLIFEILDLDGSEEISIDELVTFVEGCSCA